MTNIGINSNSQNIILGKEVANTGDSKEKALLIAKRLEGSEIVYKGNDGDWHVNEVKSGSSYISKKDIKNISLNSAQLKISGINDPVISFVEDKPTKVELEKIKKDHEEAGNFIANFNKAATAGNLGFDLLNSIVKPVFSKNAARIEAKLAGATPVIGALAMGATTIIEATDAWDKTFDPKVSGLSASLAWGTVCIDAFSTVAIGSGFGTPVGLLTIGIGVATSIASDHYK